MPSRGSSDDDSMALHPPPAMHRTGTLASSICTLTWDCQQSWQNEWPHHSPYAELGGTSSMHTRHVTVPLTGTTGSTARGLSPACTRVSSGSAMYFSSKSSTFQSLHMHMISASDSGTASVADTCWAVATRRSATASPVSTWALEGVICSGAASVGRAVSVEYWRLNGAGLPGMRGVDGLLVPSRRAGGAALDSDSSGSALDSSTPPLPSPSPPPPPPSPALYHTAMSAPSANDSRVTNPFVRNSRSTSDCTAARTSSADTSNREATRACTSSTTSTSGVRPRPLTLRTTAASTTWRRHDMRLARSARDSCSWYALTRCTCTVATAGLNAGLSATMVSSGYSGSCSVCDSVCDSVDGS